MSQMKNVGLLVVVAAAAASVAAVGVSSSGGLAHLMRPATKVESHPPVVVDNETWNIKTFKNEAGDLCTEQNVPGEADTTQCASRDRIFADGRVFLAFPGARQTSDAKPKLHWDNVWIHGFALARVATLTLVNTDCSSVPVSVGTDGAFLYVASRADVHRGRLPAKMIARDDAGKSIGQQDVLLGLPANGKKAGLPQPHAEASCA